MTIPAKNEEALTGSIVRPRLDMSTTSNKKTKVEEKGTYCHQCRRKCKDQSFLRCTRLKAPAGNRAQRPCNLAFCDSDLKRHYGVKPEAIRSASGPPNAFPSYSFTCPCCSDQCHGSQCRKKKGLQPLGSAASAMASGQLNHTIQTTLLNNSTFGVPTKVKQGSPVPKTATKSEFQSVESEAGAKPRNRKSAKAHNQTAHKPVTIIRPPTFERVDTQLGLIEADNRIGLREFLFRFRAALSLPERTLSALDDFDRPLTEASVRLFAGSMLETIRDEFGEDEEVHDTLFKYREELRYYSDLARFATIYHDLEGALALLTPASIQITPSDLGDSMVEEPQGIGSRRSASRTPQPAEVVVMLLSLANRALATPRLRTEIESIAGEAEARRSHVKSLKQENSDWEAKRTELSDAAIQCTQSADSKALKRKVIQEQKEHELRVLLLKVNLRAALCSRGPRYDVLGRDVDGRTYYILSPRPIDAATRPPFGWASGLLVWGIGTSDDDDTTPQWSHFGTSTHVEQLVKWLEWRANKVHDSVMAPQQSDHGMKPRPKSAVVEVVIPVSRKGIHHKTSTLYSELSSTPDMRPPITLSLAETTRELVSRLCEVIEWLKVLEWKGLGEV